MVLKERFLEDTCHAFDHYVAEDKEKETGGGGLLLLAKR
jgi:hypothetical protein